MKTDEIKKINNLIQKEGDKKLWKDEKFYCCILRIPQTNYLCGYPRPA